MRKQEGKTEEKEVDLLGELCREDIELYNFLNGCLFTNPLGAISKKDLATLTEEAEKSGNFTPAIDKAIFEAAQNPGQSARYVEVIRNLASKAIHAAEQEKEKAGKEGLTDRVAVLGRRIESHKLLSERTEEIVNIASKFYNEKLVENEENVRREERSDERRAAENKEIDIGKAERESREARKKARSKMGAEEKREAEEQDKREELAAMERKESRENVRREAESQEILIGKLEKEGREARAKARKGT